MMWILHGALIALAGALLIFILTLCIRAALCKRGAVKRAGERKNVSPEKLSDYAETLSRFIKCETVADGRHSGEFEKFRGLIRERFPLLHSRAQTKIFGGGCLVFELNGKNADRNVMLMSHHDVVKAEGQWSHPPFGGEIAGGALWGRGAVDTKTPLFAELTAVEELLEEGFDLSAVNLYIGSSHNEEICGDGIPKAVEYFKERGVRFDAVLDEGGAIVSGMMPGVKQKSAMVAVHEKGRHVYECRCVSKDKGHLGLNSVKFNAVDSMSAFISEVKSKKLFSYGFSPEVEEMFRRHAPYMPFLLRLLMANFGVFKPLLKALLPKVSAQVGGMLGTVMNFTSVHGGGDSPQIQAKEVTATAFFRCVREEKLRQELEKFKETADKHGVEIKETLRDYCRPSFTDSPAFKALERTLNQNFPDVIVSPFLLTAGTDARHFSEIADCILRFAPIDLDKQQFASVHNPDENITVENVGQCVCFYKDFVKSMTAL